jgi:type III secretion protein S
MNTSSPSALMDQALWLVLTLSAPPILAASVVGLLISIFQSATQLQEQTLQYALKFLAVVVALAVTAPMVSNVLYTFADQIFLNFAGMVRR